MPLGVTGPDLDTHRERKGIVLLGSDSLPRHQRERQPWINMP